MDLIAADALRDLAEVYTFGAGKYADNEWRGGLKWTRVYGAILRHLTSWYLGEDNDPESGLSHLSHAAWGVFTLLNYRRTHPELDDRVKLEQPSQRIYPEVFRDSAQQLVQPTWKADSFRDKVPDIRDDSSFAQRDNWHRSYSAQPSDQGDGASDSDRPGPLSTWARSRR